MYEAWKRVCKSLTHTEKHTLSLMHPYLRDGVFIASGVAKDAGVSQATVVFVLRLLEVAGLSQSQSLGRKGTLLRVLWSELPSEVAKLTA